MPTLAEDLIGTAAKGKFLSTWGLECMAGFWLTHRVTPTSITLNSTAKYYPIIVAEPFVVASVGWYNTATLSGTVDVGVYDSQGNLLIDGAAAQAGATSLQTVAVTNTLLNPDNYYIGIANNSLFSGGTAMGLQSSANAEMDMHGMAVQATTITLPATATFSRATSTDNVVLFCALFAA